MGIVMVGYVHEPDDVQKKWSSRWAIGIKVRVKLFFVRYPEKLIGL